ncbi:MAG: hypothetical protein P8I55_07105 [Crocinitomix sp.]|nr:hypothetical protein [Crocinitomix sp.]
MIECEKSTVRLLENNILYINVGEDQVFSLHDYKEIKLASIRLAKEKEVFNLINIGDRTIPDREAREACTNDTGDGCVKAEAIIVHSIGQRIVARDTLKNKKKHIPVKLFTNIDKAKAWLGKIRTDLDVTSQKN